jgi:hypothetical protein
MKPNMSMGLPLLHVVMEMRRLRCLWDYTFWGNSFRGDLTENLSVCVVAMRIGIESAMRQPLSRNWSDNM